MDADAAEVLAWGRPYQPSLSIEAAMATLQAGAGSSHDPSLVPPLSGLVRLRQDSPDDLGA